MFSYSRFISIGLSAVFADLTLSIAAILKLALKTRIEKKKQLRGAIGAVERTPTERTTAISPDTRTPDARAMRINPSNQKTQIPMGDRTRATRTHFIAVGAAHLVSDVGLIKQLSDKGFTVRRIISQVDYEKAQCEQ